MWRDSGRRRRVSRRVGGGWCVYDPRRGPGPCPQYSVRSCLTNLEMKDLWSGQRYHGKSTFICSPNKVLDPSPLSIYPSINFPL